MGNKEHLTFVFPLWFSHDGPKSLKNVQQTSKTPSLLSAHAGIYPALGRSGHLANLHVHDVPQQPTFATTHLRNNHMYGGVNIVASIKYYIGAFNIQLTEYNHNLRKAVKHLRTPCQILETSTKTSHRSPTFRTYWKITGHRGPACAT